eukprot:4798094-Pleurochrysis_carterae.AAC.2
MLVSARARHQAERTAEARQARRRPSPSSPRARSHGVPSYPSPKTPLELRASRAALRFRTISYDDMQTSNMSGCSSSATRRARSSLSPWKSSVCARAPTRWRAREGCASAHAHWLRKRAAHASTSIPTGDVRATDTSTGTVYLR